jgi:DNA polymerase elongation subunit (family B)
MSYVDAIHSKDTDEILVVERVGGVRTFKQFPANYVFYYSDPRGEHKTIFGDSVRKFASFSHKAFIREKMMMKNRKIFESDINPVFRCLEDNYLNVESPQLNLCFFDIEVAFDTKRGFAPIDDPFNNITAISLYHCWLNQLITLVMPPPGMGLDEAERICSKFENCILFDSEAEMLDTFLLLIDDVDVISGWNSTGFDIPYMVNRITKVLGKDENRRWCLWNQAPKKREYIKFKKKSITYDLIGRVHLDYLELYQKHNPQQLHSYRLDFVGEIETGENKVAYEGTLDDLYKKDFEKFIEYNRQDVLLLVKIDKKKKFIELANQIAHTNTVLLKTTMGSVALIEQAITNYAHAQGMVIPDRKPRDFTSNDDDDEDDDADEEKVGAVGAYVAKPKTGIQDEIGCCDINSLYPSTLRALNMSPETLVGHIRPIMTDKLVADRIAAGLPKSDLWEGVFCTVEFDHIRDRSNEAIIVDFEDGSSAKMRASELNDYVFHQGRSLSITANGTLFRTDIPGIIPGLLAEWYSQRKSMQKKEKEFAKLLKEEKAKDTPDPKKIEEYEYFEGFWNQRQQARKILLNSLYGALLNESMKFYDKRIGQSVTLTGRSIARHMNSKINEIITGEYDYKGDAIIYADTDSSYFSAKKVWLDRPEYADFEFTRENIIALYDGIGDEVNESFPEFMDKAFNTGLERGGIIAAGRELVAAKGLFIKKKKYAVLMYDKEGFRYDTNGKPGKLKVMGLDLKRSDTPQFMQNFLEEILLDLLTGSEQQAIFDKIRTFRREFRDRPGWEKGTPKKVNGLTDYADRDEKAGSFTGSIFNNAATGQKNKVNMPGHVRAAINWNKLKQMHGDRFSMGITDGQKVIVCKLKSNPLKMDSVAYPIDEPHIPDWFKELPFDDALMEETIIDYKLDNLLGVLKWDMSKSNDDVCNELFSW